MRRVIAGAFLGNVISVILVSILNFFNFFFNKGELPAIQAVNGLVAAMAGGFSAGYISRKWALSRMTALSLIYSIISLLLTATIIYLTYRTALRADFLAAHARNFILNVFTVLVSGSAGAWYHHKAQRGFGPASIES
ncbi:MAG: hypothetical protein QW390_03415 [Candidatus Bathyarchaeia archaeon]